jgi:YHS domain-containing protein
MKRFLVYTLVFVFAFSLSSCARRVVVAQPASITIVKKLPRQYKVVRVKGKRYYFFNGNHYRKTRNGYVVVRL